MKGYEEVSVPAVRPAAPPPGEEIVKISDMEKWAQLAFAGYKYNFTIHNCSLEACSCFTGMIVEVFQVEHICKMKPESS